MFISGHPFDRYRSLAERKSNARIGDIAYWRCERIAPTFAALLSSYQEKTTKRGEQMGVLTLDDGEKEVRVVCFPKSRNGKSWSEIKPTLFTGKPYLITGRPDERGDSTVIASDIVPLESSESSRSYVEISVSFDALRDVSPKKLTSILKNHQGDRNVILKVTGDSETAAVIMDSVRVSPSQALLVDLDKLFGEGEVKIGA